MIMLSNTNLNLGKQLLFASIAGSSLIAFANYEIAYNHMPSMTAKYSKIDLGYSWENEFQEFIKPVNDSQEYDTILSIANKVVSESEDIDVDIQIAVNKIFWDLLLT